MHTTRRALVAILLLLIVGGPVAYGFLRQKYVRNFRIVEEGKLYRSGQLSAGGFARTIDEYRINTVISLRYAEEGKGETLPPDHAEEKWCRDRGMNYVRIRTQRWGSDDGSPPPAWSNVNAFLRVMDDPKNYPVLIHCFAGMHRTGAHCAIYRMEYQGWTPQEAIEEMRRLGYENIDTEQDVKGFLTNYRKRSERGTPATPGSP